MEAALDFKLEAVVAMLQDASRDAASALAGVMALDAAVSGWPILRTCCSGNRADLIDAPPPMPSVAEQFVRAARGVASPALHANGWVGKSIAALSAGWTALLGKLSRVGDAYDRAELSEKFLSDAMVQAAVAVYSSSLVLDTSKKTGVMMKPASLASFDCEAPSIDTSGCGFWAGTRTAKALTQPSSRGRLRSCGAGQNNALHAVARLVDPYGSGLSATRTLFFPTLKSLIIGSIGFSQMARFSTLLSRMKCHL